MFPRVVLPRAGCLVLFRILAQFGFTQGGQEYTPKVDWFKLNKYFYKLTTSSQPTPTHFLISPEKNKSQILIFRNHFCSQKYHFSSKMFNFHSEMVNLYAKLSICSKNSNNSKIRKTRPILFEIDQFYNKNGSSVWKSAIFNQYCWVPGEKCQFLHDFWVKTPSLSSDL